MTVKVALAAGTAATAALLVASPAPTAAPTAGPLQDATTKTGPVPRVTELTREDVIMAADGCGTDRWAVKTASDADRYAVSTTQHQTTVDNLRRVPAPSSLPSNRRIRPYEITEYVIAGTLT